MAVALANTSLFAPYEVSTWSSIPAAQKASNGLWVQDYGGYMAVGYSSKFGTITSLSQLLGPKFKNAVALNGNPTSANAALNGVMMANLAEGGSASNIADGVSFFQKLKAAGNFSPVSATGATIKAGTTPVVFNWDYLNLPSYVGVSNWKVFIPSNAVLGGYYAQAINKNAPHPAAARLWEEFLYSQAATGGQNLWLAGRRQAGGAAGHDLQRHHQHQRGLEAARGHRDAGVPQPVPGHRRRELPGGELGEGRQLARERGCRCDNRDRRPAFTGRAPAAAPAWVGTVPFLAYVGVFLLLPTGIVVVDSLKNPNGAWAFVQRHRARQPAGARLLHRLVQAVPCSRR